MEGEATVEGLPDFGTEHRGGFVESLVLVGGHWRPRRQAIVAVFFKDDEWEPFITPQARPYANPRGHPRRRQCTQRLDATEGVGDFPSWVLLLTEPGLEQPPQRPDDLPVNTAAKDGLLHVRWRAGLEPKLFFLFCDGVKNKCRSRELTCENRRTRSRLFVVLWFRSDQMCTHGLVDMAFLIRRNRRNEQSKMKRNSQIREDFIDAFTNPRAEAENCSAED